MPSLKGRVFNFILRNRRLLHFQLKREKFDFDTSIPEFREQCERSASRLAKLPQDIELQPVKINGMTAEWIIPSQADRSKVILYVHGGGYVSGSCDDHRAIVAKFARSCGVANLLFDYRLAPEHPFPSAVEDSMAAYNWLLSNGISPSNIIIAGESAGGGLCLATLVALRDSGIPLPAAAVALSPWTDLACTGESYRTKAGVCLSPQDSWTVFSKYYAAENDPCMPWISPLYADLSGLPPMLIYVGEDEVLRDDSVRFAEKAEKAGVDAVLRVGEGMVHCYPLLAPMFPEATAAMEDICGFIGRHIGK